MMQELTREQIIPNLKLGVIGKGFVGGAIHNYFHDAGCEVFVYDKYKQIGSIEDMKERHVVYVCLPTPLIPTFGYDYKELYSVGEALKRMQFKGIVILKSTVEPGFSRKFAEKFGLQVVYNPEFLSTATADKDFAEQRHIVLGTTLEQIKICGAVSDFYRYFFHDANISISEYEEAECVKLFCNSFYAVKVQIFNEFALLCMRLGVNYDNVRIMMLQNGWINPMHTLVPGTDGKYSYGNICFPKDTNALAEFMERHGSPHKVLSACIEERNGMRE